MYTASSRNHRLTTGVAPWARLFATLALTTVLLNLTPVSAFNRQDRKDRDDRWVATWGASPQSSAEGIFGPPTPPQFNNQTMRMIARISVGGDQIRVRLNNGFGNSLIVIGEAHLARHEMGAGIDPNSDRTLLFGGSPTITIPAGASVLSDPVSLAVPDLAELAVSIYLPNPTPAFASHATALQTTYISGAGTGNLAAAATIPSPSTTQARYFLSGIDVRAETETDAIVAFGDSITDGFLSTADANRRWPDVLAERLLARQRRPQLSVVNEGISGNRLLHDLLGPNALSRFDQDAILQANVKFIILLIGINDIGLPTSQIPNAPFADEAVTVEEMIQAYRLIIDRAHSKGLKIIGGTLLPYDGSFYFTPEGEAKRQAVNEFIRHGGQFDGVIDFDRVMRDPDQPTKLLARYDSGDRLHPNDAGYEAMAMAIDLRMFSRQFHSREED
ncbi:MAG TPA: SGNH/GDSL hydrolase family protein, partial [Blastocatellia bacterium]|nr:SGNH/GDSL hydrolase family protein [Blastocatellia bacterium]